MNAITYQKYVDVRRNTPFRIVKGEGFYLVNGHEIPAKEFEAAYPLPLIVKPDHVTIAGNSLDGTKRWLFED